MKSGTFRPAKFVKYLPRYNWQPLVITITTNSNTQIDDTLVKDLPNDLQVIRIRAPHPHPRDHFVNWVKRWGYLGQDEKPRKGRTDTEDKSSMLDRIKKIIQKFIIAPLTLIQFPPVDHSFYWSLRIIPVARRIIKENDVKLIYTTSPPFSPLVTGWILKNITGIPWVADFRDPWTTDVLRYKSKGWRLRVNRFVEHHTLRGADSVIGVTPNWVEDLQSLAGEPEKSEKYHLITNGYDESDFTDFSLPELDVATAKKITHIGSIYHGGIEDLLNGLSHIDHSALSKLRIELIGYMHPHELEKLTHATYLSNISYQPDRISHEQSLVLMRNSHVLFLSLPYECYPGKVFEYMRVGRPVLAIAQPGAITNLINQTGIGCVVSRNDSDNLIKTLEQIAFDYEGFVGNYYHPNWEVIHQFERRVLTKKLSTVFNNVSTN
jgi:glycosyltransferase involved in cell wall biosynthesis